MPVDSTGVDDDPQAIAIAALGFIASNDTLLPRFLALTGIETGQIRQAAGEPGFLAGVLGFITAHEPTLMAFSGKSGIKPQAIADAARALSGGGHEWLST